MLEAPGHALSANDAEPEPAAPPDMSAASPRAYRIAFTSGLVVVGVTTVLLFVPGSYVQKTLPGDSSSLLDAGWRVYNGQRPHLDFPSHLGALSLGMVALGMWLAGPSGAALYWGYAALFPVLALWVWALAQPRLPPARALLFALFIAFLTIGQRPLSAGWDAITCAMEYNRLGWALLLIMVLPLFLTARTAGPGRQFWEGASTGLALALLFFLKLNYFVAGAGAIVVGAAVAGTSRRTLVGMGSAFVVSAGLLLVSLHVDLTAYWDDTRRVAGVQSPSMRLAEGLTILRWNSGLSVENKYLPWLPLMAVLAILLSLRLKVERRPWRQWLRPLTGFLALVLLGLFVCAANAQRTDIPLFGAAALILCEAFRRAARPGSAANEPDFQSRYLLGSGVTFLTVGFILAQDVGSVADMIAWKFHTDGPKDMRIDAPSLRDLVYTSEDDHNGVAAATETIRHLPPTEFLTPYQYAVYVNDGLHLIRPRARPESRVLVLDWTNPFSFALGLPGARGDTFCWHVERIVDEQHCPAPERVLQEVTLVMVPKRPADISSLRVMRAVYGPAIDAHFEKIGESRLWTLYGKRSSPASARKMTNDECLMTNE
jgi:hypothetical protein